MVMRLCKPSFHVDPSLRIDPFDLLAGKDFSDDPSSTSLFRRHVSSADAVDSDLSYRNIYLGSPGTSIIINIPNREPEQSSKDAGSQNPSGPRTELAVGEEDLRFSSASLCGSVSGRVIGRPCLSRVCASGVACSRGLGVSKWFKICGLTQTNPTH